jgi:multiple sugar transport system permease protein
MALSLKPSFNATPQNEKPKRRKQAPLEDANERTLVSPLAFRRPSGRVIYWVVFALLLLSTLITLGPLYWMFSGALKSSIELDQPSPTFWPSHPGWDNYINAWKVLDLPLYFVNTLILAAGAVLFQLLVSATAAYSISKLHPAGKNLIQFGFFCTLMVPPVVYLIPQFVNINDLPLIHVSLINNWAGVWLPEAANAFNILVLKSFFDSIPNELTEAARLDGANAWQLFTRIATWKDFLWPLLVLTDSNVQSLQLALYYAQASNGNMPFTYLIAGLALASIPPIVLFLFLQKQIIRGISLTGLRS